MALTQATIADVVSPRERGRYQVYISAVWAISSLCGPLVGGFVAQHLSWRWIFWINLPIGAVALLVCNEALRRLPRSVYASKPRLDILGMFLLAGAISVLLCRGNAIIPRIYQHHLNVGFARDAPTHIR